MSGLKKRSRIRQEKKPLSHGWTVVTSKTYPDRVYFYNTITKCSTWNNPCADLSDIEYYDSSSESSSVERKRCFKNKSSVTPVHKKQNSKFISRSPDHNCNIKINKEIEDYDEQQDQYFDNVLVNAFSFSHPNLQSSLSSPGSEFSLKTNTSDSDQQSDSNLLLEDNKQHLWVHFVSNHQKPCAKKSVALSDFDIPCTSKKLELEMTQENRKNNSFLLESESFNENSEEVAFGLKKKKKKKKEHLSRSVLEKPGKNVSFKVRDKTPAQTRLLKLRKKNAEKLSKLAAKYPDLLFPMKSSIDNKNSNSLSLENQLGNNSFNDVYPKKYQISNSLPQDSKYTKVDYSEEMDWEPSNEESDVRNINVFRQQLGKSNENSSEIFSGVNLEHSSTLPFETQKHLLFLVLDTNIFVSCLSFVKELRDSKISNLGYPVIYVPWRVLQELDRLKDTKIDGVNKQLHVNVRKAITYLHENFKSRHPRVFGQSFEDFANMVYVEASAPDDEILQTCIQFQKQFTNKRLVLLTNDKNLESKAIVSGVEVYSKERFQKKFLNSISVPSIHNSSSNNPNTNKEIKIDDCLCEMKAVSKEFLSSVVETEMKIAFEEDWIKLAFKKPPFSLQDALDCFLKHWRSVFFVNFSKEAYFEAERLYEKLFKKVPATSDDVIEIIKKIQRLILSIRKSQKKKRPYLDLIPSTLTKLSSLLRILSPNHSEAAENVMVPSVFSVFPTTSGSQSHSQEFSQDEETNNAVSKVKNLFKDIWDSLRSFCCSISDVIHSGGSTESLVQDIRLKISQSLNEVEKLVIAVEKIFEINLSDINEYHPLIIHFSDFLISGYPAMAPDLKNDLPKNLAAFFTNFEGRSLLSSSLNDFKEFIQDISKAAEYFNTHCAC